MRWEVADLGILVVFRHKNKIIRSKVVLLQAKRLYSTRTTVETNPLNDRLGFNDMFIGDEHWKELSKPQTFTFADRSRYKALEIADNQYEAIEKYERRYKIPVHYLFYNPPTIPMEMEFPITTPESEVDVKLGCRVLPSKRLREMIKKRNQEVPPSFANLKSHLGSPFDDAENIGGWRLETYIVEHLLALSLIHI